MLKKILISLLKSVRKDIAMDELLDDAAFMKVMEQLRVSAIQGLINLDDDVSAVDYYKRILELEVRIAHRFRRLRREYEARDAYMKAADDVQRDLDDVEKVD